MQQLGPHLGGLSDGEALYHNLVKTSTIRTCRALLRPKRVPQCRLVGHVQNVDITTVSRDLLPNMSRATPRLSFL